MIPNPISMASQMTSMGEKMKNNWLGVGVVAMSVSLLAMMVVKEFKNMVCPHQRENWQRLQQDLDRHYEGRGR